MLATSTFAAEAGTTEHEGVSLKPQMLVQFGGFGITNSMLVTWIVVPIHSAGAATATVKPILHVSPLNVGAPGDGVNCNYVVKDNADSLSTEYCHVTLSLPANASGSIKWSVKTAPACSVDRVVFIPASSGTLAPGKSTTVWFIVQPCSSTEDILFSGPNNTVKVTFWAD